MSPTLREAYRSDLINQAAELTIHCHTPLPLAHSTPLSMVQAHFKSSAFAGYRKSEEAKQKTVLAVLARIDGVIKAVGGLYKVLRR